MENVSKQIKSNNYDIFDLTKVILSIMVMAIHAEILPNILYPWLRIAVPLFFIISSFLFFNKVNKDPNNKTNILKQRIKKELKYYFVWFILLLPFTIYLKRTWIKYSLFKIVLKAILEFLFSSTFVASWFIVASLWALIIICLLANKTNNKKLIIIATIIYLICCFRANCYILIKSNITIYTFVRRYESIFRKPMYSFPIAIVWMSIGKIFADHNNPQIKTKTKYVLLIICSILLFIENRIIFSITGNVMNNCYLFLAPVCYLIFDIIKDIKINIPNAKQLRQFTILAYPSHGTICGCFKFAYGLFLDERYIYILSFISTVGACVILYKLIKNKTMYFQIL